MSIKDVVKSFKGELKGGGGGTPVDRENVTSDATSTYELHRKKITKTPLEAPKTAIDSTPLLNILTPSLSDALTQTSYRSVIRVGPSVILLSIKELGTSFGLPPNRMTEFLRTLEVPTMALSGELYVNLPVLETALFELLASPRWASKDLTTHRTLVGMMYGSLSADAVKQKVVALAKTLTRDKKSGRMRKAR